ncbi:MAG: XdhC family protein [bacterium]|nr:XdhC family protein [bacterium]
MNVDVLERAVQLRRKRQAFVLASVIWRRGPSSSQQGSQALILPDGSVRGWLGGGCAEPLVISEAMECLGHGEPRLLCLGDSPERGRGHSGGCASANGPDGLDGDIVPPAQTPNATSTDNTNFTNTSAASSGLRQVAMSCESSGAMEVYLEPTMPAPQVVVIGRTPCVDAICAVALALGWDAVIVDVDGLPADHECPELVRTSLDLDEVCVDSATAVVVATQGHYDDAALVAALGTTAGYLGLVASAKRAGAMRDYLASEGFDSTDLNRICAPAGMDLGCVSNREIAVAVMADLVARRARGELAVPERKSAIPEPA